jgi:hypothetical protein
MKTLIAALALTLLAAGPTFAATPWQINNGNGFVSAPSVHQTPNLWTTSREGLVEAH